MMFRHRSRFESAIPSSRRLRVAAQFLIGVSGSLKQGHAARIEFDGAFQIPFALLPIALSASDQRGYLEHGCVARQFASGDGNLSEGGFIIEITLIGDPCRSQMRLTTIGAKAQSRIARLLRKRYTGGSVINSQKINIGMCSRQFTIGEQERWIVRYRLIQ